MAHPTQLKNAQLYSCFVTKEGGTFDRKNSLMFASLNLCHHGISEYRCFLKEKKSIEPLGNPLKK